ncbi:MAG: glycoside hydrolase N-terminal domain-containing protein, partial [Eubacteriales bacterium]|nr:glycoside hydrolase N-terminal domain-containing protein [Eubacteriales bacterium]
RARELALSGRPAEAQRVLEQDVCGDFFESYLPMGTLTAADDCGANAGEYRRSLDLDNACALTSYTANGCRVLRTVYASFPANALVMEWRFSQPRTLRLSLSSLLRGEACEGPLLMLRGQCPSRVEPSYVSHPDPVRYDPAHPGIRFAMGLRTQTDGQAEKDADGLTIRQATRVLAVLMAETSFQDFQTDPTDEGWRCEARLRERLNACELDAGALWLAHLADYQALETACTLKLPHVPSPLPTDERLRAFAGDDAGLYELLFRYGRYLMIASSREGSQAANLQGIWNAELRAPWSGNYTLNINTEMNYWPVFSAHLGCCAQPLVQLVKELSQKGGEVARAVHGAPGWCAYHNADLWRSSGPVGNHQAGSACYGYWPMGGAWLCRTVWERYEYTRDEAYLRDTALPLLEGAARFLLSQLCENAQGELVLCPATSSENNYLLNGETLAVASSTAMMQSLCEDVLQNTRSARKALGLEADADIEAALSRLKRPAIGLDGRVLEWDGELEEAEPHHRHISHLYGLHPAQLIAWDSALGRACKRSLEARGDEGTGWSLAWKVNQWARLRDGDHALCLLNQQLHTVEPQVKDTWAGGGSYPNLFCAHPPFQIDGNFGAVSGMLEMLVQSDEQRVTLLPALPARWPEGELTGACARGGLELSLAWKNGRLTHARVMASRDGTYELDCAGAHWTLALTQNESVTLPLKWEAEEGGHDHER